MNSNTAPTPERGRALLDAIGSGTIESLKWIGLIAMVAEHWMRYVAGDLPPWVYRCGRVAFPLFVISLALGLRNLPVSRLRTVVVRLFVWALIAQASLQLVNAPEGQLNVLFTLAVGTAIVLGFQRIRSRFVLAIAVCAAGGLAFWCEFSVIGVAFVAATVALARAPEPPAIGWAAVAALLVALALVNRSHFALAAIPIAVVVWRLGIGVPRVRRLFYWAYVLQYPVYAGARLVLP